MPADRESTRAAKQQPSAPALPICRPVSVADDILGPKILQDLYLFWSARRAGRALPNRGDLDVFSLQPWLGYLSIVEPLEGGRSFRYRLFGSELTDALMCEMTAKCVEEMPTPSSSFLHGSYRLCQSERRPVYSCHDAPLPSRPYRWHRLVLPLARPAGEEVFQFLTAAYPEYGDEEPLA